MPPRHPLPRLQRGDKELPSLPAEVLGDMRACPCGPCPGKKQIVSKLVSNDERLESTGCLLGGCFPGWHRGIAAERLQTGWLQTDSKLALIN